MKIRLATIDDRKALAQIHTAALGYTFLGKLGTSYLSEIHYKNVLSNPQSFTFVAETEKGIDGFVTFSINGYEFENQLKSNRLQSLPYLALAAIKAPWIVKDVFAMLVGSQIEFIPPWSETVFKRSELFTISVNPKTQSKGLGSALIEAGILELKKRVADYNGCYVKTDTDRAEKFYSKNGFVKIGSEKRGQTRFSILVTNN